MTDPVKQCFRCKKTLPLTSEFFYKNRTKKDGFHAECKECSKVAQALSLSDEVKRERVHQGHRAWCETHKDSLRERHQDYYHANKETMIAQADAWYSVHKDAARDKSRKYRARKHAAEGTHNTADVLAQYDRQKGRCYWCGSNVGDTYDVDHVVPLSRGGTDWPDNLVIACPTCNKKKNAKLPHEWVEGGRLL